MFRANLARTGIQLSTAYPQGIGKVNLMANKKEPPFFNEDNVGPFYYKLPFYETMELFIETLTGTCFELRVSPFETVISVKAKIQRLEGIPICQQHLIWNNMELEDDYCLNDYNISEGCTLKLVLAMRGGPINTRRVPVEDPLREMAEYTDSSRDEVWEKSSCNKQVTFLVYREGDQLNFFRVVDRGYGTLTPLSESLRNRMSFPYGWCQFLYGVRPLGMDRNLDFPSIPLSVYWKTGQPVVWVTQLTDLAMPAGDPCGTGFASVGILHAGSVYNLYTDDDEEIEPSPSGQQIIENSITMNKMKLLKAKMETMNLSKKPKKTVKVKSRPPLAPRPSSGSMAAARHRLLRVLPHIGQCCLPPPGNSYPAEPSQNALSALATLATTGRPIPSLTTDFLKEDDNWESTTLSQSISSIKLPAKVSHVELESTKQSIPDAVLPLVSSLSTQTETFSENLISKTEEDTVIFPSVELCATEESLLPEMDAFALLAEENVVEQYSDLDGTEKVNQDLVLTDGDKNIKTPEQHHKPVARMLNSEAMETSILNPRELSPQKNRLLSPLRYSAPITHHGSLVKPQRQSKCFETGSLRSPASQNVFRSLDVRNIADPSFPRTTRFRGVKVDSPGKRSNIISKGEARDITEMANRASKEPVGSVNNIGFLASLARSASRDGLQSSCGASRLWTSAIALSTNLQHFQEESLRKSSTQIEPADFFLSTHGLGMNGNNTSAGKRVGETTHHLPPVKAPVQTKKKTSKHCFLCGKKTGLATSYECRCGNNFCATHRYAETHGCTYDYKSAGRRYLQEANPAVSAPKLPKI
ncbi:AN1-type zinc finger protein 4 isoform X1 [Vombatus ursinus]|uniref:AN1-type zinc finger protein 4 isoform X1 n=1 Tax=Vombatus ursinus TaxID=29139 RepID=UPI000FFDA4B3|nr:AN1-type zinc finger protein 4 isoform X1 [Vombatus ursinus]